MCRILSGARSPSTLPGLAAAVLRRPPTPVPATPRAALPPDFAAARRTALALLGSLAVLLGLAGCASPPPAEAVPPAAAGATRQIVATAHPLATRAALLMLEQGGSGVDAAVAAQMVLGLVEPHASGPGGGSFVMMWDAATRRLSSLDGLATAPARATASLRTDTDGQLLPSEPLQRGGRSVGVPGTVAVFAEAHRRAGRLPWRALFQPAIEAAEQGFAMPPYLHAVLSHPDARPALARLVPAYFDAAGRPLSVGTRLTNPAYGATMRRLAEGGAAAFLADGAAERIVAAAQPGLRGSLMTTADLQAYRPVEREPVCGPFLAYRVCTMAPPSFGGLTVLQTLQLLQYRAEGSFDLDDPQVAHLYAEASRLAQADRRLHVGDPDFVPVPTAALASTGYLRERARLIDPARANPKATPGRPPQSVTGLASDPEGTAHAQTSQIVVADARGNVVTVTTTNNLNFGARLMADGFVLNNALTNFSAAPRPGERLANQMEPRKRPATSMAPTIVFDAQGQPVAAGGAAGGGPIVDYVARALVEMLANGRTPAQAVARGHQSLALDGTVHLEAGTRATALAAPLRARGHTVEEATLLSGAAFIRLGPGGWVGGADPRRDGVAAARAADVPVPDTRAP
jgi:gamma-glutamyltranspeptidase/glutathione hydrolase